MFCISTYITLNSCSYCWLLGFSRTCGRMPSGGPLSLELIPFCILPQSKHSFLSPIAFSPPFLRGIWGERHLGRWDVCCSHSTLPAAGIIGKFGRQVGGSEWDTSCSLQPMTPALAERTLMLGKGCLQLYGSFPHSQLLILSYQIFVHEVRSREKIKFLFQSLKKWAITIIYCKCCWNAQRGLKLVHCP